MIVSDCSVYMWVWGSSGAQIPSKNTHFSFPSPSFKTSLKQWGKPKQIGLERITSDWLTSEGWVILKQQLCFFGVELTQSISSLLPPTPKDRVYFVPSNRSRLRKKKWFSLLDVLGGILKANSACVLKSLRNGLYLSVCFFPCFFTPALKHVVPKPGKKH